MLRLALLSLVLVASAASAQPHAPRRNDPALDRLIAPALADRSIPAMAVLVIRDGRVAAEAVGGVRASDRPELAGLDDAWHFGSEAKAMTAALDVVAAQRPVRVTGHDAWCFIGSLPGLVGELPDAPYLPSASGGRGIGVMLSGSRLTGFDLPDPLAARPATLGDSLHPDHTGARDFAETAAIISRLALVVSIDTSVAHLSAAMGKPTYVIVAPDLDWRWGRHGVRTPWYPTVRLFRLPRPQEVR